MMMKTGFLILLFTVPVCSIFAQDREIEEMLRNQIDTVRMNYTKPWHLQISKDKILQLLDNQPSFEMYKDNYIITGVPTNKAISKSTADVKFQVSVCQRITKTILPFNTFLMLTYTQKSFWNIYQKSSPFDDNNYNPGLAFVKPVIPGNQLKGIVIVAYEHESNGKDSLESRSWDYLTLSGTYFFNTYFSVQAKVWTGILGQPDEDCGGGGNPDLYNYRGYGLISLNYRSFNDKLLASAIINPRKKFGNFNIQLELNFKLNAKANQYFFIQWYNGYGESLLEYNRHSSMLRAGICIKPLLRSFY
jgi:phospholipase A1